jgi:hypothetical protein
VLGRHRCRRCLRNANRSRCLAPQGCQGLPTGHRRSCCMCDKGSTWGRSRTGSVGGHPKPVQPGEREEQSRFGGIPPAQAQALRRGHAGGKAENVEGLAALHAKDECALLAHAARAAEDANVTKSPGNSTSSSGCDPGCGGCEGRRGRGPTGPTNQGWRSIWRTATMRRGEALPALRPPCYARYPTVCLSLPGALPRRW